LENQRLEYLKQQYEYEDWRGANTLDENLFVWNFLMTGSEFPGWTLHSYRPVVMPGWPAFIQSIWKRPEAGDEAVLRVDVYQCSSRGQAHEFLVQVLGQAQLPAIHRQAAASAGDVTFAGAGDAGILFARANLVFIAVNAGRQLEPVTQEVHRLDRHITSKPGRASTARTAPRILRLESTAREYKVGEKIPLEVEAADPSRPADALRLAGAHAAQPESPLYLKFFSPLSGEVLMEGDRLVYHPNAPGQHEVTAYAINTAGAANREVIQLAVTG
jgi:hypothetical protein